MYVIDSESWHVLYCQEIPSLRVNSCMSEHHCQVLIEWFMVDSRMAMESQPNIASRCGVYPQKSAKNYRLQTIILLSEASLLRQIDMFPSHMHVYWTYLNLNKCFSVPGGTAPLTHLMSWGALQRWDTSAVTLLQYEEVLSPTPEAAKGGGKANLTTLPHLISSLSPPMCCKWTNQTTNLTGLN